jgi:hypothetical protein
VVDFPGLVVVLLPQLSGTIGACPNAHQYRVARGQETVGHNDRPHTVALHKCQHLRCNLRPWTSCQSRISLGSASSEATMLTTSFVAARLGGRRMRSWPMANRACLLRCLEDHASSSHPARGAADAVRTCIGIYIYAGYRHFDSSSRCTDLVTAATLLWGSVACCSACHVHY